MTALAGCSVDVMADPEDVRKATALPRAADAALAPVASAATRPQPEPICMFGCELEDSLRARVDPQTGMRRLRWVVSRVENASTAQQAFEMVLKSSVYRVRECLEKIPSASIPKTGRVRLGMSMRPDGKVGSVRLLVPSLADPEGCFGAWLSSLSFPAVEGKALDVVVQLDRLPAQANLRLKGKLLHEATLEDIKAALYAAGFRLDANSCGLPHESESKIPRLPQEKAREAHDDCFKPEPGNSISELAPGYHRIRAVDAGEDVVLVFVAPPKNESKTLEVGPLGHVSTADLQRWIERGALHRSGGALIAVEAPDDKLRAAAILDRLVVAR